MNELTNKELVDMIEMEAGGTLAREVKRRLNASQPVNVERESYIAWLEQRIDKLERRA